MKRKTLLLTFIFGMLSYSFAQDQLRLESLSGRDYQEAIASIGRMTVSDNVLRIYAHDGSILVSKDLLDIDKITFGDMASFNAMEDINVRVYPNPTQDVLFVDGLPVNTVVRLFSVDGRLLETIQTSTRQTQLQVSTLPRGTYLLQMDTRIVRFIKN